MGAFVGEVGEEVVGSLVSDRVFGEEFSSFPKGVTIGSSHDIT